MNDQRILREPTLIRPSGALGASGKCVPLNAVKGYRFLSYIKYITHTQTYIYIYMYIQSTPDTQGTGKSVNLARCPTYPRFRISCKYDMRCAA